mgnify:FL=1|jgi:hypothetical protein
MISRKLLAASAALVSVSLLSGCTAAGKDAPTSKIHQVTDGVERDSGAVKVRDFLLIPQADGSAVLVGTVVNQDPTADAISSISVKSVPGKLTGTLALEQNTPVIFSGDSANAHASFPGVNLVPGERTDVTITFGKAAGLTFSAIVREKSDIYANVA